MLNIEPPYSSAFECPDRGEARRRDVLCFGEVEQRVFDFISRLQDHGEDFLAIALV
jgi:hypothetical protein